MLWFIASIAELCTAVEACIESPCCHYGAIAQWRLCWQDKSKFYDGMIPFKCLSYSLYKERKLSGGLQSCVPQRNCQWRQGRPCDGQTVELIIAAVLASLVPGPCFAPQLGNPGRSFSPRIVITIIKTVFKTKQHGAQHQHFLDIGLQGLQNTLLFMSNFND